ncbi:nucleoporin protein Ndc1-Nup [Dactylonectria macrodidyma]|uniref:Nucleoporin protein Ndc1-Nup n=1 Tax=Dactylonectria macrodidyma TaxID=307937 RepID=A0A9P9EWV0_9HYPO|nr:nucleoporin protein Ndc1-Nup [Dactylonectria macrodidyma]
MAATTVRKAPYKDFLQPALHRRFTSTATVLLAVSYLEAVLLDSWNSYLWGWFPLGPVGVRTACIFTCGLAILVLRIANYHVGLRTTGSGFQTLSTALVKLQTYEALFWYGFSSLFFCHIFLWSASKRTNLQWITSFSGDRSRLNERPLFFMAYLASCAITQTFTHYKKDVDRLVLGLSRNKDQNKPTGSGDSLKLFLQKLPVLAGASATGAATAFPLALFLYYAVMRSFVWGWALVFLRPFYNLPKTNMVPPSWPMDIFLMYRCIQAGTLIHFIWNTGNFAFSTFMVKEPLKNGNPLTSESKDPNGSILNGLKSKKLSIKSFALWELAYIAQGFETRRQAIYEDIDRKDGPMWSQIYRICMEVVTSVETRIDNYGKPPTPAPAQPVVEAKARVSAPLRDDPIFTSRAASKSMRGEVEKRLGQVARSPGSSPASKLSPLAKKTFKEATDRVLSKEQQEMVSPEHLKSQFEQWTLKLMSVDYVAALFQQDFRTQFAAAVLGTPYAEPTLIINAVHVLCRLSIHSLAEDQFGNVHRDVVSIIRTLTAVIKKLEAFRLSFPIHWTDIKSKRESPEVDEVLSVLRTGLSEVVAKFEPYSSDLRLTMADLRLAKEASATVQE